MIRVDVRRFVRARSLLRLGISIALGAASFAPLAFAAVTIESTREAERTEVRAALAERPAALVFRAPEGRGGPHAASGLASRSNVSEEAVDPSPRAGGAVAPDAIGVFARPPCGDDRARAGVLDVTGATRGHVAIVGRVLFDAGGRALPVAVSRDRTAA